MHYKLKSPNFVALRGLNTPLKIRGKGFFGALFALYNM
jgi:hypothetical protein